MLYCQFDNCTVIPLYYKNKAAMLAALTSKTGGEVFKSAIRLFMYQCKALSGMFLTIPSLQVICSN